MENLRSCETAKAEIDFDAARLLNWFADFESVVVAFSGGVDSAVVAKASCLVLGPQARAVTADSPSLSRAEFSGACALAQSIGIRHQIVQTGEVADPRYQRNDGQRCFYCKSHLFSSLEQITASLPVGSVVVTGTNRDDLGDHRPGLQAALEHGVRSPLAELGIGKARVRQIANLWGLAVADKPASPCLASRIAYGVEVTPERLRMVEAAEQLIRELGIAQFRVRCHADNLARIEVDTESLPLLLQPSVRCELMVKFRTIGFRYVTIDMEGFRSGNLNQLLQIQPINQ